MKGLRVDSFLQCIPPRRLGHLFCKRRSAQANFYQFRRKVRGSGTIRPSLRKGNLGPPPVYSYAISITAKVRFFLLDQIWRFQPFSSLFAFQVGSKERVGNGIKQKCRLAPHTKATFEPFIDLTFQFILEALPSLRACYLDLFWLPMKWNIGNSPSKWLIRRVNSQCDAVIHSTILLLMSPPPLPPSRISHSLSNSRRMDHEIFFREMPIDKEQPINAGGRE
ncbi:hypothetical protein VNO78_06902 [Psophocarpus tetragonolobus]|uniref:Uncharacterized protein n=1 Tax=Psophocarpus tetragonolobus TaxID=3891 RepID=A0AAN9SSY4_PSOTE